MNTLFEDKGRLIPNVREGQYPIDPIFLHRWSPRAFDPAPIPENILMTLFEAARWSMSCFNEQPWRFFIATAEEDLKLYRSILSERNQKWTITAPVLGFMVASNKFAYNGKPNFWAPFDTGAAWMAMTMQARKLGLYTHGMGGFDREKVYDALNIPREDYTVIAAFALGRYGDREKLPEDFLKEEQPNNRKPLETLIIRGKM